MHQRISTPYDPPGVGLHGYAPGRSLAIPGQGFPMGPQRLPNGLPYDNVARQVFGGRALPEWRGDYDPIPNMHSGDYGFFASMANPSRNYGLGAFGGAFAIPVPVNKTLKLWYMSVMVPTGATVGSNYDLEAGMVVVSTAAYTQVVTALNQPHATTVVFEAVASNINTPLFSATAATYGTYMAPFIGLIAGSTDVTGNNPHNIHIVYTIE